MPAKIALASSSAKGVLFVRKMFDIGACSGTGASFRFSRRCWYRSKTVVAELVRLVLADYRAQRTVKGG